MSTFVLIPGAGSDSWYWHRVVPLLEAAGHVAVAPDLPCADETKTFPDYADVVVEAVQDSAGDAGDVIVVGQSLGGFTAPLVCERLPARLLVLVAAMVPRPGEAAGEWWDAVGYHEARRVADVRDGRDPGAPFDEEVLFLHDVPAEVLEGGEDHWGDQAGRPMEEPWPLDAWPDVDTRFLLCREDRFFPAELLRRITRERLGIEADEMGGGHLQALSRPDELVEWLLAYEADRLPVRRASVDAPR
ncbi:MAG: alpha/beta hydrolase [Actinomycetota bacterium]|nr:alpha/beta hydrolase [Actinomycetota bacterium]